MNSENINISSIFAIPKTTRGGILRYDYNQY